MNATEIITITVKRETLDAIRKQAVKEYRSISKHIAFILDKHIEQGAKE
jgi:hypothetical protein